jgi:hypothetical protein
VPVEEQRGSGNQSLATDGKGLEFACGDNLASGSLADALGRARTESSDCNDYHWHESDRRRVANIRCRMSLCNIETSVKDWHSITTRACMCAGE